jgi:hypothetical protein
MRRAVVLLVFASLTASCTPRTAGAFLLGMALADAVHEHAYEHREFVHEREVVYVAGPPVAYLPSSPRDAVPESPASFDSPVARRALEVAPMADCKARGLPAGYGHAKVTFALSGHASNVLIDAPAGLKPEAVACVGETLGAVLVPPFQGAPVTVGTTWFVR